MSDSRIKHSRPSGVTPQQVLKTALKVAGLVSGVTLIVKANSLGKYNKMVEQKPGDPNRASALAEKLRWFDMNHDGELSPGETIERLREMGAGEWSAKLGGTAASLGMANYGRTTWPYFKMSTNIDAVTSSLGVDKPTTLGIFNELTRSGDPKACAKLIENFGKGKGYLNLDDIRDAIFDKSHAEGFKREKFRAGIQMNSLWSLAGQIMPDGKVGLTADRLVEFSTNGNFFARLANRRMALIEGRLAPGSSAPAPANDKTGYCSPGPAAQAVASDEYLMTVKKVIPGLVDAVKWSVMNRTPTAPRARGDGFDGGLDSSGWLTGT